MSFGNAVSNISPAARPGFTAGSVLTISSKTVIGGTFCIGLKEKRAITRHMPTTTKINARSIALLPKSSFFTLSQDQYGVKNFGFALILCMINTSCAALMQSNKDAKVQSNEPITLLISNA